MKRFISMVLAIATVMAISIPALAESAPGNGQNYNVVESTHSPMARDVLSTLAQYTFSGLNDGHRFWPQDQSFDSTDISHGITYYYTNLTTDGWGKTVDVAIGRFYFWSEFVEPSGSATRMDLVDSSYGYPTLEAGKTYYGWIYNTTGGTLKGTVRWCDVVDMT